MKTIPSLIPGSPAWLQSRSASKAPAVMSASRFQTRSDLMHTMATGLAKDVDSATQALFDAGHASEAAAREIAEDILCDGLSPVCGESDDGYLTASFDGLTFDGKVGFEHKLWNDKLAAAVRADELPEEYKIQMDQQILVGGLDYVLFMVSDGTRDKCVSMEYRSTSERAAKLLAAWRMFDEDLANYKHIEILPAAVAAPINELPALCVEISGSVTASNLEQWRDVVTARIAGINTNLQTDQDFADADSMVKFLDDGEKRIDLVKSQAQANAADIDRVFRALDEIKASMRAKRLELDKLVTKRKESIKIEIMQAGKDQLAEHIASLNKRLKSLQMPPIAADFATAIKGKRNLESMRGAVADLVAAKKIESNEIADRMQHNMGEIVRLVTADTPPDTEWARLFPDMAQIVLKAPDDLLLLVRSRIDAHNSALAAERNRVRAEEEAKATAKAKAEQEEAERRRAAEEAAAKIERDRALSAIPTPAIDAVIGAIFHGTGAAPSPEPAAQPAAIAVTQAIPPAPVVAAAPVLSEKSVADASARTFIDSLPAAQDNGRYIRLGELNTLLEFDASTEFLAKLGFAATKEKNARLYRECDVPAICQAIIDHVAGVPERMQAGKLKAA